MHSFKNRLLTLIVVLVALAEGVTIVLALVYLNQGVRTESSNNLISARTVLNRMLEARAQQLRGAGEVMVADFAFREAATSGDRPTIRSVLQNHARRIDANVALLYSMSGEVLGTTLGADSNVPMPPESEQTGDTTELAVIAGHPYQLVFVQLRAPQPIAWVALGFSLDQALAAQLRDVANAEIAFVARAAGGGYVSSTLGDDQATRLLSLSESAATDSPRLTSFRDSEYLVLGTELPARGGTVQMLMLRSLDQALAQFRQMWVALLLIGCATLVAAILVALFAARSVVRPLGSLVEATRQIARGDYQAEPVAVRGGEEFEHLAQAFNVMQEGIRQREQRIFEQATRDSLTGSPNRRAFRQLLESQLGRVEPLSVAIIDVRRFRDLNASVGYHVGDQVLRSLAARLHQLVGDQNWCARIGADQFAIGMPLGDTIVVERLLLLAAEWRQGISVERMHLAIEMRLGVAEWRNGVSADDLLRQAGVALVEAKSGNSVAVVFQPSHDVEHRRRVTLVAELRRAIANDDLHLVYQPLVQMKNREAVMLEALVRWTHASLGEISPGEFVPLAERASMVADLSRWVMAATVRQLAKWRREGLVVELAVNLSATDIADVGLPMRVLSLLQQHGVPASQLILEVTESTIMSEPALAAEVMQKLRTAGVRFAVDDFGTGHSSLAQLHALPVDELKIDRAFVMNLDRNTNNQAIVRATTELGHSLGLRVVAEGVETPEVWSILLRLGCDIAQGYFISRPMAPDLVPGWMQSQQTSLSRTLESAEQTGLVARFGPRKVERPL